MQQPQAVGREGVEVDARIPTPLYHQIFLVLREQIYDGSYPDQATLPSEHEAARLFGVSRITAKRALDELAAVGLVVRQRGRGTRVRYRAPAPPVRCSVEGLLENLLVMGLETEVQVIDFAYVDPPDEVARALGSGRGEKVQRAVRTRLLQGQPFSYLTTFVPADLGRSYDRDDLLDTPLLVLLERCGVVVSSAEQTITAALADTRAAAALKVDIGSPLLRITRVVRDQQERPVEYITGLYRPDRYQYRMALSRVQGETTKTWSAAEGVPRPRAGERAGSTAYKEKNP